MTWALASAAVVSCVLLAGQTARDRAEAYYLFLVARQFEGAGDIDAALAAHRRAVALAPGAAEIHAELAGLFARQNRGDDALREGTAALALDPANREAHRILGFVYGAMFDADPNGPESESALDAARQAASHFEQARDGRPGDPASELTLGRLYLVTGRFEPAVVVLRNFLLDQPGYGEAILLLAEAHAGEGDTAQAIGLIEQVVADDPGLLRAAVRLAELYEETERWTDAASLYRRLAAETPRLAPVLEPRRASALVNAGRLDEARALLDRLTRTADADAALWHLSSQAALRAGDLADAERAARKVTALDARDARGVAALADVWIARREYQRALETLDAWIAESVAGTLRPQAERLIVPRAAPVLSQLGQHDRAIDLVTRASSREPEDLELQFELGAAYERARRPADAERVFRAVIEANPAHALALNYLGYMLADRGERLDEAVSLVSRALALEPDNPSYQDSLGWAYYRLARYDLAEPHLAAAAASAADSSLVQDHYGDVLFALKRYRDAAAAWRRALDGDRSDVDPSEIERKMERAKDLAR